MAEQDDDEKTEEPTAKRLEDARRKGDVAKSTDVPIWFLLLSGAFLVAAAYPLAGGMGRPLGMLLDHPHSFRMADGGAQRLMASLLGALAAPILIVFTVLIAGVLLGHVIQSRPLWTAEKMKPKLDKLSPLSGLQRMFGMQAWMNLLKSFLKMVAVTVAVLYAVWPDRERLLASGGMEPVQLAAFLQQLAGRLFLAALVAIGMIAGIDYVYQRQAFMKKMRMSRQDIRDEMKQSEGDPEIKARLRAIRQQRARQRMMQQVPRATVVVTNPTHYAIALRYEPDTDAAPVCLAKGVDAVALRIRKVAEEADVPVIENPPLARALFASVDIDETIPREHFEAVAKVISFVMNTRKGGRT